MLRLQVQSIMLFLVLLASPMSTLAIPVTVEFELGWLSDSGDFNISPKQGGSGSFTYDTGTPVASSNTINGNFARYNDFSVHPINWEFTWNGMTFSSNPAYPLDNGSRIDIYDDRSTPAQDLFTFRHKSSETGNANDPNNNTIMDFRFDFVNDETACPCGPLTSSGLPLSFNFGDWDRAVMQFSIISTPPNSTPQFSHLNLFTVDVAGNVRLSGSVPEPATLALMSLGLVAFGFVRRIKHRGQ